MSASQDASTAVSDCCTPGGATALCGRRSQAPPPQTGVVLHAENLQLLATPPQSAQIKIVPHTQRIMTNLPIYLILRDASKLTVASAPDSYCDLRDYRSLKRRLLSHDYGAIYAAKIMVKDMRRFL